MKNVIKRRAQTNMEIRDNLGNKIGELSFKVIHSTNDLLNGTAGNQPGDDIREIMKEISSKVKFPAVELRLIQIFEDDNCGKKYGSQAMKDFFECVKSQGCSHAVVQVGKIGFRGSLERSIRFYKSCGWIMCCKPLPSSLRFAYVAL